MSLKDLKLILGKEEAEKESDERPPPIFKAGSKLSGFVSFEIVETHLKIIAIQLQLNGKATTRWKRKSGKRRATMTEFQKVLELKEYFQSFLEDFHHGNVPLGAHELPFDITLPEVLPSSFQHLNGEISYEACLIVDTKKGKVPEIKREFKLIGNLKPGQDMAKPIDLEETRPLNALACLPRGNINLKIHLNKSHFAPGGKVSMEGQVVNSSCKWLSNFEVNLVEKFSFRASALAGTGSNPYKIRLRKKIVHKIKSFKLHLHPGGRRDLQDFTVTIPADLTPELTGCSIIKNSFELSISIDRVWAQMFPVRIGFLPNPSTTEQQNEEMKTKKKSVGPLSKASVIVM